MAVDLERIEDSPTLLDLLINAEDILDSADVYAFSHWFDGEVVEGPLVRRHWVSISLLYPHDKKPDPRGGLRLEKLGVGVRYLTMKREADDGKEKATSSDDHKDVDEKNVFWMVKLTFPRRLLGQTNTATLDIYDDEIDADDVEEAQDAGMNDETGYQTDQQGINGMPSPNEDPNAQPF